MEFYSKTVVRELANGMRIYVLPRPGSSACVNCVITTGSIHEGELLGSGVSHFLEHLLFQGSRAYPGHAAADAVERLGGYLNAYTTFNHTAVTTQTAAADVPEVIRIIADMVRYPVLPEEAFRTEREVILRECDLGDDDPGRALMRKLLARSFTVSPVRIPVIGYRSALEALTVEQLRRYHRERYQPGRIFWVVTGGVEPESVFDAVASQMAEWTTHFYAEPVLPQEPPHTYYARYESIFADPVARFAVSTAVPGALHRELPALEVLSGILGKGESSRFVRILEKESELALHFTSSVWAQGQGGLFALAAAAQPDRLDRCLARLLRELENLRRDGVSAAELSREKKQLETQTLLSMRTLSTLASTITSTVLAGGTPDAADRYGERLKALTCDEVNAAARQYLAPERLTSVLQRPEPVKRKVRTPAADLRLQPVVIPAEAQRVETVMIRDASLPLVDFSIVLPGGAIFERPENAGVSGLVADLLTAGAGKRNERQLAVALDACGAEIKLSAGRNALIVSGSVMHEKRHQLLELLGDVLSAPRFEEAAFERVKQQQSAALKSLMNEPKSLSRITAVRYFYGEHPYRWCFGTSPDELERISLDDVKRFHETLWHFDQVRIGFSGRISEEEAARFATELCQRIPWRPGRQVLPELPRMPATAARLNAELKREQCFVELFMPGPAASEEASLVDVPLLSQLENGLASPLFQRIREERHLAYATGVRSFCGFHPGLISFYAVTAPERAAEAAIQLQEERLRLCTQPPEAERFEAARKSAVRSVEQMLEQCVPALESAVLDRFYGRPAETSWTLLELLRTRTCAEWQTRLHDYFASPATLLVTAGGQSR